MFLTAIRVSSYPEARLLRRQLNVPDAGFFERGFDSCARSMLWIDANHKKENADAVSGRPELPAFENDC
jgi:hypothetical protein